MLYAISISDAKYSEFSELTMGAAMIVFWFVCLFILLLYVPSQQLWSWREGQFT